MIEPEAATDLMHDELAVRILNALTARDLTRDEAIALGVNAPHTGSVLTSLQAVGLIEAYCGPLQPSTCIYKLAEKSSVETIPF
jgi:hypothetical protein